MGMVRRDHWTQLKAGKCRAIGLYAFFRHFYLIQTNIFVQQNLTLTRPTEANAAVDIPRTCKTSQHMTRKRIVDEMLRRLLSSVSAVQATTASSSQTAEIAGYYVRRTRSNQLPVYTDIRNGKTRLLTLIRRIDGDPRVLSQELKECLGLNQDEITVNRVTGHVVVKGRRKMEIVHFLESKGF